MEDLKRHLIELAKERCRIDGRKPLEWREIEIKKGIIKNAEGSAWASIGNTQVVCGIKLDVCEPYLDAPDKGVLKVSAELCPIAHPEFEPGPPEEGAIELARVIDRGIRSSDAIQAGKLCIRKGELVWCVHVDLCVINHDGNLIDAGYLAAIAALSDTRFPKLEGDKVIYGELTDQKLEIALFPLSCTFAKLGNFLFLDPCLSEEEAMDARLTVCVGEDGAIYALHKGGSKGMKRNEVRWCVEEAIGQVEKLRKMVK